MLEDELDYNENTVERLFNKYELIKKNNGEFTFDEDEFCDIAEYLINKEADIEARTLLDEALKQYSSSTRLIAMRAREEWCLEGEKGNEYVKNIIQNAEDKNDIEYHYIIILLYLNQHQSQKAYDYVIEKLNVVFEDDREDFLNEAIYMFIDYDEPIFARQLIGFSEEKNTEEYADMLGQCLYIEKEYAKVETIYKKLIDDQTFNADYWKMYSKALFSQNKFKKSLQNVDYAIAINPKDNETILLKASILFCMKRYNAAIEIFKNIEKDAVMEHLIASSYMNLNEYDNGIEHLLLAKNKVEDNISVKNLILDDLAIAYGKVKQVDKAFECLTEIELNGGHFATNFVSKGNVLLCNNMYNEAEDCFHTAISLTDKPKETIIQIAEAYYDNDKKGVCFKMLKDLLLEEKDETMQDAYILLAKSAQELKQNNEFLMALKYAVDCDEYIAQNELSYLFPEDLSPKEYYSYAKNNLI